MAQLVEFAGNHVWLVAGLLASWAAVAFYELRLRNQGTTHVTAADAVRLINKGALVIDVRKPEEFQQGHIVNARNVPLERMQQDDVDTIKKQKSKILLEGPRISLEVAGVVELRWVNEYADHNNLIFLAAALH